MFGSDILDIAIGLVLVYLIFSVLMTSVAEAVESLLKTRAGQLEHAIGQLLQGDQTLLEQFYNHPLIYGLYRGEYPQAGAALCRIVGRVDGDRLGHRRQRPPVDQGRPGIPA